MAGMPPLPPGFTLDQPKQDASGQIPPLPPGFTLDGAQAPAPQEPSLAMAPVGGAEMLMRRATGVLASIPAGVAYGGAALGKALGANVEPRNVQSQVQEYLTYDPISASGKAGERTLQAATQPIIRPIAKYADKAATAVGKVSPVAETMLREAPYAAQAASAIVPIYTGIQATKNAVAMNRETQAMADMTRAVHPTPEQAAIDKAQQLGLKLLPSQQERSAGALAEGLTGQAKLERTLSKQNAEVVDAAAAEEVGISGRLTRKALAAKKAEASRAYGEVAKIGKVSTDDEWRQAISEIDNRTGAASFAEDTPAAVTRLKEIYGNKDVFDAADAVSKVRQLRADASRNIKALNAPEQNALGYAQRKVADAIDDQLERAAQATGNDSLVSNYIAGRQQLAKIHSVEDAMRGQNVSAKALYQQLQRKVPLSGKLRTIAESYGSFDRVLQDVSKLRNTGPLDVVDYLVGAGAAVHNPLLATAALSRPAIRAALASDWYQGLQRSPVGPVPPPAPNALAPAAGVAAGNALAPRRVGAR